MEVDGNYTLLYIDMNSQLYSLIYPFTIRNLCSDMGNAQLV